MLANRPQPANPAETLTEGLPYAAQEETCGQARGGASRSAPNMGVPLPLSTHPKILTLQTGALLLGLVSGHSERCMSKKEDAFEVEGTVTQALANTRFRVQLETGSEVMAHVAGKMRNHAVAVGGIRMQRVRVIAQGRNRNAPGG